MGCRASALTSRKPRQPATGSELLRGLVETDCTQQSTHRFRSRAFTTRRQSTLRLPAYSGCYMGAVPKNSEAPGGTPQLKFNKKNHCFKTDGKVGFLHGVASFDPQSTSVLIWTRLTPLEHADHEVTWRVCERKDMLKPVASGSFETNAKRDYTVTVDVTGLVPYKQYSYQFSWGNHKSIVGQTRTLSDGRQEEMRFACVCCSNFRFGFFNAYEQLAKADDLDFIVHVGDYIYEYGDDDYPLPYFENRKGQQPAHEAISLQDYRQRYACYRLDAALQKLHAKFPMIAIWDDHEIANDSWSTGAENHQPDTEGDYQDRTQNAIRAYLEWVPIRNLKSEKDSFADAFRVFQFGDLATLICIETRLACRSKMPPVEKTAFYEEVAKKGRKYWDHEKILPAKHELMELYRAPENKMIGDQQVEKLGEAVRQSVERGQPWQILMSQTIFARLNAPKLQETVNKQKPWLRKLIRKGLEAAVSMRIAGEEAVHLARMYLGMGKYGVPMNPVAWDGYAHEREQVMAKLNIPGSNPIVLGGDSHNAWAHEVADEQGRKIACEFDAPAISAIGAFEDIYSQFQIKLRQLSRLIPLSMFTPWICDAFRIANPDSLKFCNLQDRGFILMHVTKRKYHAEFHFVDTNKKPVYKHHCDAAFDVENGSKGKMSPAIRYMSFDGEVPKRHLDRSRAGFGAFTSIRDP